MTWHSQSATFMIDGWQGWTGLPYSHFLMISLLTSCFSFFLLLSRLLCMENEILFGIPPLGSTRDPTFLASEFMPYKQKDGKLRQLYCSWVLIILLQQVEKGFPKILDFDPRILHKKAVDCRSHLALIAWDRYERSHYPQSSPSNTTVKCVATSIVVRTTTDIASSIDSRAQHRLKSQQHVSMLQEGSRSNNF